MAQSQGRWLTPDPAGAGWNQYAYPTNPNSATDPSGLYCAYLNDAGKRVEEIDDDAKGKGDCSDNGGYWISGSYGGGSWVRPNVDNGTVMGLGYDASGNPEVSVAGAMGSNAWGNWTQTYAGGTGMVQGNSGAANNGWSLFGWDKNAWKTFFKEAVQPWKDTCAQTFAKAFGEGGVVSAVSNNLEGGPDPDQVIKEAGGMVAAQYVVNNGLAVPLRSSIYRGILSGTETAATGFVLLDAYTRIGQGLYEEGKSYLAGECR